MHVGPCLENSSSWQPEEEGAPIICGQRSSPSPLPLVLLLLLVCGAISSQTLDSFSWPTHSKTAAEKMESFGLEQPLCDYNESMDGLTDLWDTNSFDSVCDSRLYLNDHHHHRLKVQVTRQVHGWQQQRNLVGEPVEMSRGRRHPRAKHQ